jgi:putative hydrolase of the HAD superfamily
LTAFRHLPILRGVLAITFDLWDTLFVDDSDEPVRASRGMRSKQAERRFLLHQALSRTHPVTLEQVSLAYDVVDAAFRTVWHEQHVTWTVRQRLSVLLEGMKFSLPEAEFAELVRLHEEMELTVRPRLVEGVRETLGQLKGHYPLAVISDAIFSPGRALRELLRGERILDLFDVLIFSDEVGCSKPDRRMFERAASDLGVPVTRVIHIGDRDHNDVKGAQAAGARAVLFTGVRSGNGATSADAVCRRFADLPRIVEKLIR